MELPPIARDEDSPYWVGRVRVPWYRTRDPVILTVMTPDAEEWTESRTSPARLAAFDRLAAGGAAVRGPILALFCRHVPELAAADWAGLEGFFALDRVLLFPIGRDGLGYVGLVFVCLQWDYGYEHGAGVILHGDRVVHFGAAEEAETGEKAYIDAGLLEPDDEEDE